MAVWLMPPEGADTGYVQVNVWAIWAPHCEALLDVEVPIFTSHHRFCSGAVCCVFDKIEAF